MLSEYDEIKEEIKNAENAVKYIIQNQWKLIVSLVKNAVNRNYSVTRTRQSRLTFLSNCTKRKGLSKIKHR